MHRRRAEVFVGRERELAALGEVIAGAARGAPGVALVGGDAGIGKSALVREAADRAAIRLLLARCARVGGGSLSLAPLVDLVRQVRRRDPALLERPELAPLTGMLVGQGGAGEAGARLERDVLLAATDLLVALAAEEPVLVCFEDLHWADPAGWDLFELLARNLVDERVVLAGTFRSAETDRDPQARRRLAELARLPHAHRLGVGGLDGADVARQAAALLGVPPPRGLVDDLVRRGEGNPFFTAELVAAHLSGEPVPAALADLLAADLDGLDEPARHVLAAVAVIGRGADHELVAAVADLPGDELEAAVRAAMDAGMLVVDPVSEAYQLRHALIGEVVDARLLPPQRRRLHRAAADALTRQPRFALRGADLPGELALHLDRAGDRQGALEASLAAADAGAGVAPDASLAHLERALALWDEVEAPPSAGERLRRLWQAAELANATGDNDRAVELARLALPLGPPPRGEAWGHERLARYLWAGGHLAESAERYEHAAALAADLAPGPEAAIVHAGLAQAWLMFGRYDDAEAAGRRALDELETPAADPMAWAMAQRVVGVAVGDAGRRDEAVERCRDACAVAPEVHLRALARAYLGIVLLDAGRYDDVRATVAEAVTEGRRAGLDSSFVPYLVGLAAEACVRLGRWDEADELLTGMRGAPMMPMAAMRLALVEALLATRRGDDEAADAALAVAAGQPVDASHRSHEHATRAEVELARGRWDEAAAAAAAGLAPPPPERSRWPVRFTALAAIAAVEQQLDARARREPAPGDDLRAAVTRLDDVADASGLDAALLATARAHATRLAVPEPDRWATAAATWEDLGDGWSAASARVHEAEAAVATGDLARASDALRSAHAAAAGLGAGPLLAHVDQVAARTRLSVEAPAEVHLDAEAIVRIGLTAREGEVLALVAAGRTNRQIGEALYMSEKTASVHVSSILRKLGVTSRVEAAAVAQRIGLG